MERDSKGISRSAANSGSFPLGVGLKGFHFFFLSHCIFQIFCNALAVHLLSEKGAKLCSGDKATQTRFSGCSARALWFLIRLQVSQPLGKAGLRWLINNPIVNIIMATY